MFDTVHLEAPRLVGYSINFSRIAHDLDRLEAAGKGGGWRRGGSNSPYLRTANLEPYGIPILVHQQPRWNLKGGDKIEYLGAGKMRVSEMVAAAHEVYKFDIAEASILRLDCTADVKDVPVGWFYKHTRVRRKIVGRAYGTWSKHNRSIAETVYAGQKPNQLRIYDKTAERMWRLGRERMKLPKAERGGLTYEGLYGMSRDLQLTRVENQMGARSPEKIFGCKYFGEMAMMASKPVFQNMVFPETARPNLKGLRGKDAMTALYLLSYRDEHGLAGALNEFKRHVSKANYYRDIKKFEAILHGSPGPEAGITLAALTQEYRTSSLVQLAA